MRNLRTAFLLSFLSIFMQTAFAGSGHSHGRVSPVNSEEISELAVTRLSVMVKVGAIDKSWENALAKSVTKLGVEEMQSGAFCLRAKTMLLR